MSKRKIAILGGGVAGMTTAFWLTNDPATSDELEVTVYQLGWRLGGKGASGRNLRHGQRIEEHGLHIWLGFYDNSFNTMQKCYAALDRSPDAPLATWDAAFKPRDFVLLNEQYEGEWSFWPIVFPPNPEVPGTDGVLLSFWDYAYMALKWMWELLENVRASDARIFEEAEGSGPTWPPWLAHIGEQIADDLSHVGQLAPLKIALRLAEHLAHPNGAHISGRPSHRDHIRPRREHRRWFCQLLTAFKDHAWKAWVKPQFDHDKVRVFWYFFDTCTTMLCGMLEDDVLDQGFDVIDGEDLRAWMQRHGAADITLENSPLIRGIYDLAFAYEQGKTPNIAAGTALRGFIRLAVTYKGSFYYMMQAGMGDTVFAPMYEVLRRRGVRFEFFNVVTHLGLSDDQKAIETVTVKPQVTLTNDDYDPLVLVKDLPCWPSEPLYDQIEPSQAALLQADGINLERDLLPFPDLPEKKLKRGTDFDEVVLAISIAALPAISEELTAASPAFAAMLEHIATTQTQAFQVWVNRPEADLGLPAQTGIMDTYVEPLDTYANMSHLIKRENWLQALNVQNIGYFCGVLADVTGETQAEADQRAKAYALAYLREHIGHLWPQAIPPEGDFDWNVLVDREGRQGAERFEAQYWRANVQPTERYVLSVAGSTRYRLKTDETDFNNLYLAGDWTYNGLNAGCIEATVMSGMQASRAICGYPETIVGETDAWLKPEGKHHD